MTEPIFEEEHGRDLDRVGHYVGVNWQRGLLAFNNVPMSLNEFMDAKGILDPGDCLGPFAVREEALAWRGKVAVFFQKYMKQRDKTGINAPMVATLMDLFERNMI